MPCTRYVFIALLEPEHGLMTSAFPELVALKQRANPKLIGAGALAADRALRKAALLDALVDASLTKVTE